MAQVVITAVGADKPGLVGDLTGLVSGAGGNILDSRMINLRGQFAVIMLVEVEGVGALREKLAGGGSGLKIDVTEGRGAEAVAGVPYKIKTYSMDQPGLVHKVSAALRGQGVNIEELVTRQENAAFAGTPLFIMEMRVTVPPAVSVRKLRGELERVCEGLNMDLDMEPG